MTAVHRGRRLPGPALPALALAVVLVASACGSDAPTQVPGSAGSPGATAAASGSASSPAAPGDTGTGITTTPPASSGRAVLFHLQLAGDIDRALPHYRESIRLREASGNVYGAATTRFNVALDLADSGRVADAREYARAALRNFETYGAGAAEMIQRTQQLLARLDARPQ